MPDANTAKSTGATQQDTSGASGTSSAVKKDDKTVNENSVVVPEEAKKKYPDLVELVLKSESMNAEERNYWLQVLPVMTPDQVAELRDILETEKKKLAAIDAKYSPQKSAEPGKEIDVEAVEKKRREAREKRKELESEHREEDQEKAEDLLSQLDEL